MTIEVILHICWKYLVSLNLSHLTRCVAQGDINNNLFYRYSRFSNIKWYSIISTQRFNSTILWAFHEIFHFDLEASKICLFVEWNFSHRIAQFGAYNIEAVQNECNGILFFDVHTSIHRQYGMCMASIALNNWKHLDYTHLGNEMHRIDNNVWWSMLKNDLVQLECVWYTHAKEQQQSVFQNSWRAPTLLCDSSSQNLLCK